MRGHKGDEYAQSKTRVLYGLWRENNHVETGRLAKQADGAVLVSCEKTQVLVTVCSAKEMKDGQDFFPLLVDYRETLLCCGKISGGIYEKGDQAFQQRNP